MARAKKPAKKPVETPAKQPSAKPAIDDTGRALLGQVLESPDDDVPKLVYADWLEEQGDPYAALIRAQCPPTKATDAVVKSLLRKHEGTWIKPIEAWLLREPHFERGMVRTLWGISSAMTRKAEWPALEAAASRFGVREVSLRKPYAKLGSWSPLGFATALEWRDCQLDDARLAELCRSPNLRYLRSLSFEKLRCTDKGLASIALSPHLARVRHFGSIKPVHLGSYSAWRIHDVVRLLPIKSLELTGGQNIKIKDLVDEPVMAKLERLAISVGFMTAELRAVAESTQLTGLEELEIHAIDRIKEELLQAFLDNPAFTRLKRFGLRTFHAISERMLGKLRERFGDGLSCHR